jgi:EAL domain-containing protein (putative c-di-GMP-specific phosphodiesterase class I)
VDVDRGQIVAVEALARWQHPERGLLTPAEFIGMAEETGLIIPLGTWVLEEACRQYARWRPGAPQARALELSVNLSARQAARPDFPATVEHILAANRMKPYNLCLEITENVLMEATRPTIANLGALRELGVHLAIDDFGTGYSSLGYLKHFKVDSFKIDRSFTGGLERDPRDAAIVAAVVTLAHTLGLTAVAEGVETVQQLERLRKLRCDFAQGHYFGTAQPAGAFGDAVENRFAQTPG